MTRKRPEDIVACLTGFCYVFSGEKALHDGIAKALDRSGVIYERERALGKGERLDFLTDGGVAIEVKVDGSFPDALRQVDRYLQHEEVTGAVIAATNQWARETKALIVREKPVRVVRLTRAAF